MVNQKSLAYLLLAVAVSTLAGSYVIFEIHRTRFALEMYMEPGAVPQPPVIPSETRNLHAGQSAVPADWKTYRNEEYGFEVKHPEQFGLSGPQPASPENNLTLAFSNRADIGFMIGYSRGLNPNRIPIEDVLKTNKELPVSEKSPRIPFGKIGGVESVRVDDTVWLTKDGDVIVFVRGLILMGDPIDEATFDQILSTFRFLK